MDHVVVFGAGARRRPAVLGGAFSPLGWAVGFVEAPHKAVVEALLAWRRDLGADLDVVDVLPAWPGCLQNLDPLESPWTTELLVPHAERWTAYLNNHVNGRDPWPVSSYLARVLRTRWVIAEHQPMTRHGHASTQLWLGGSDGQPPLGYLRTITAHAGDGRWAWETSGPVQPFEQPDAYRARKISDRFPRRLLVDYLHALGIAVDDDQQYGNAVLVRQRVTWPRRTLTLDKAGHEIDAPALHHRSGGLCRRPQRRVRHPLAS